MKKLPVDHIHLEISYAVDKRSSVLRLVEMDISIVDIDGNVFPIFIYNYQELSVIAYCSEDDSFDKIIIPINRYEPLNDCIMIGISRATEINDDIVEIVDTYSNGEILYTYIMNSRKYKGGAVIDTNILKYSEYITPYIHEASVVAMNYDIFNQIKEERNE